MIITQTPLRIGLVGGGTDLPQYYRQHGGRVLNCAIDKYVYVIVKERFDDDIYVNYSKTEVVGKVMEIEHELVREAMRMASVERGVEITMLADIPSSGSGLGSSSSITVGLLQALYAYRGRQVDSEDLAEQACEIEIERCGKPIGKQDQYVAALGGIRDLKFGPGEEVQADEIVLETPQLRAFQAELMLFYTGITRSADTILREQRANVGTTLAQLGTLRDLAGRAACRLAEADINGVGRAVREGWEAKRELASGVTTAQIDHAVTAALEAGASGAKVTGAGGGGFLLVICPVQRQARVRERLVNMRELPIKVDRFGSRIVLNMMREIWS
ncbi:MAG: GHMP kinase [Nitrososphaerales archaeon]